MRVDKESLGTPLFYRGVVKKKTPPLKFPGHLAALLRKERGPDEELKLQFEAVSRLDPDEKKVVRSVIESIILRHEARRWAAADAGSSPG